jgi:hypothetical protein
MHACNTRHACSRTVRRLVLFYCVPDMRGPQAVWSSFASQKNPPRAPRSLPLPLPSAPPSRNYCSIQSHAFTCEPTACGHPKVTSRRGGNHPPRRPCTRQARRPSPEPKQPGHRFPELLPPPPLPPPPGPKPAAPSSPTRARAPRAAGEQFHRRLRAPLSPFPGLFLSSPLR